METGISSDSGSGMPLTPVSGRVVENRRFCRHGKCHLLRDFPQARVWEKLAKAKGLRLPRWNTRCTPSPMGAWLKKLGISVNQHNEWGGFSTLGEWIDLNPDWPLRAWVGLMLEYRDGG